MSTKYNTDTYGVEVVEKVAYVTPLKDSSDSHGLAKGNDFMGTKEECLNFIKSKDITRIHGFK